MTHSGDPVVNQSPVIMMGVSRIRTEIAINVIKRICPARVFTQLFKLACSYFGVSLFCLLSFEQIPPNAGFVPFE